MMLLNTKPEDKNYAGLTEIHSAAIRSSNLTKQLLAFARRQTIAPVVLDLNRNIELTFKMLNRIIGEDIHLSWKPGDGLWPVKIDPTQLGQILINLCLNARDSIEHAGTITFETSNVEIDQAYCIKHMEFKPGAWVQLTISDDGCGIDKQALAFILITDVVMPGMNGKELETRIEKIKPNINVLFMSGYASSIIVDHGVLDENVNFLQKPFSIETFSLKVREVLDQ